MIIDFFDKGTEDIYNGIDYVWLILKRNIKNGNRGLSTNGFIKP
jgi:hypothetical protein